MDPAGLDRCAGRLLGKMRRAARRWGLFSSGSRIALGVSGGRDSLALVELMSRLATRWHPRLELAAFHVRVDSRGRGPELSPEIREFIQSRGMPLIEVDPRGDIGTTGLRCFQCSRIRRRSLFEQAEQSGFPTVALGHHADDVVETWLMSLFFSGSGDTLLPVRRYFDGAVTIIRPMIELRRGEIARLARLGGHPPPAPPCPDEDRSRRTRIENALKELRPDERLIRRHLFWAAMRAESIERKPGVSREKGAEHGKLASG